MVTALVMESLACVQPILITPSPTPLASLSAPPPPALTPTATPQTSGSGKWMEIPNE